MINCPRGRQVGYHINAIDHDLDGCLDTSEDDDDDNDGVMDEMTHARSVKSAGHREQEQILMAMAVVMKPKIWMTIMMESVMPVISTKIVKYRPCRPIYAHSLD